jgi:hypothetical protein
MQTVLFEVINEGGNKDWDWRLVNTVHNFEKEKPKQQPLGLTAHVPKAITISWPAPPIGLHQNRLIRRPDAQKKRKF